ncbi:Putative phage tail protein [Monaibacterium marinum]|uniref:Phage tail protein n=1 Tax=Pontivivens marinum TaxID=1690039 RepID=A0A2C9CT54_9RHOB|nr:glycoside hydrolase/phage tail family protein [Monaibacterium marinum]SOH94504.1 Putative phage tail protein [Monaibacterium marinum]
MATLLLAAAGSAIGGAVGGTVMGLTSAAIGQAVGASLGSLIDQRIMGAGASVVETGRLDTWRVQGAQEGTALPYIAGRTRLPGQMIWSTRFLETVSTASSGGGKGSKPKVTQTSYTYSVSFALALCEGVATRIGRIWADGKLMDQSELEIRFYDGSDTQMPDPVIAAIEGTEDAPAYRGTAYVVFEGLDLTSYGNRIPQINVEVYRQPSSDQPTLRDRVQAVALIPGTGEYALATEQVSLIHGPGEYETVNVNNDAGAADVTLSLDHLQGQFPEVDSTLMVASWFGTDLRAGQCEMKPGVEQVLADGDRMPWVVSGLGRSAGYAISRTGDRVNYGGTPADASIVEAIAELRSRGVEVTFYPFILMDIAPDNGLPDPLGGSEQGAFPWRGRILATANGTAAAVAEVEAFFGPATAEDFTVSGGSINYAGSDFGFARMVLHYAHLCKAAGGVAAFCIGSEMRDLLRTRDEVGAYPAVTRMIALAAEVRAVLGPDVKLSYAADWSEYYGHHDGDDVIYHLDPLWADANIDFVGIDNYMPLSDWRAGDDHLDAQDGWRSIHDPDYLKSNIEGGEGYDWYYATDADREGQLRTPITDSAYGDDHVFRNKDIRNWWERPHFDRHGGVRSNVETAWVPRSKPIWFTEFGCAAIDKGTNQPNVFRDIKSSENSVPYFSTGARDDFIQHQYINAVLDYWGEDGRNPVSEIYDGPMLRMDRAHVWAWDARPWPDFPNRVGQWSDGVNFGTGHWISGRQEMAVLADVVREVCARSGVTAIETKRLFGGVAGMEMRDGQSARSGLQPLMLAYGFDCRERDGVLHFFTRDGLVDADLTDMDEVEDSGPHKVRGALDQQPDRVRLSYIQSDHDYQSGSVEAALDAGAPMRAETADLPVALGAGQAKGVAERWLAEALVSRDTLEVSVPPSLMVLEPGDVIKLDGASWRIDRIEEQSARKLEAVRVEAAVYVAADHPDRLFDAKASSGVGPVLSEIMDLPLLRGDEVEHTPYVAAASTPWPGPVNVFLSPSETGYELVGQVMREATLGVLTAPLPAARAGVWSGGVLRVELSHGALEGRTADAVLDGANIAALRNGDTGDWEIIQFRDATLVGPKTYELRGLLRGQAGTEFAIPDSWPQGTRFVALDGAAVQIDLPLSARGLDRYLRIGPALRSVDDATYSTQVRAFDGAGLRPYSPAHLRGLPDVAGGLSLSWVRRTRIDGDLWGAGDVPLNEERESYLISIEKAGTVLATFEADSPAISIAAADLPAAPYDITVGQISARFGSGPTTRMTRHD